MLSNYYLLNTSGTIVKNKTAAKDGNDWYFYVDNKVIKMYHANNNTLTGGVEDLKKDWNVESKLISDGIDGDVLDTDMVDDGI